MNGHLSYNLTVDEGIAEVGSGWEPLVREVYLMMPNGVQVTCVKEKFGALRIYTGSAPMWFHDYLEEIEKRSMEICERCGKPGILRADRSWLKTLCDNCNT